MWGDMLWAMMRAIASFAPPGAVGTTMVIVFEGKVSAKAWETLKSPLKARTETTIGRREFFIEILN
jgi:hypothetical protein